MLRRFAPWRMLFTTGGGSALHVAASQPSQPKPQRDAEEPAGAYLPWTARPWAVTHSVHHAQWKFLDTVFAHLATVTPAELSERTREQGARDVLRDLEEPVMALLRQQARQARQLRRQAKAKTGAKSEVSASPAGGSSTASSPCAASTSLTASSGGNSSSTASSLRAAASVVQEATEASEVADSRPATSARVNGPTSQSTAGAAQAEGVVAKATSAGDGASAVNSSSNKGGAKKKKTKKSKSNMKSVAVIHYL